MTDWPLIAPLLTYLFGICSLFLSELLGRDTNQGNQKRIVLFVFTATLVQILITSNTAGISQSGLFRSDGLNIWLIITLNITMIINVLLSSAHDHPTEREWGPLKLLIGFFSTAGLLANSVLILVIVVPMLTVCLLSGAYLSEHSNKKTGFKRSVLVGFYVLMGTAIMAVELAFSTSSYSLALHKSAIMDLQSNPNYRLAVLAMFFVLIGMLPTLPSELFKNQFVQAKHWTLSGQNAWLLLLLPFLLLIKIFWTLLPIELDNSAFVNTNLFLLSALVLQVFALISLVRLFFDKNMHVFFMSVGFVSLSCVIVGQVLNLNADSAWSLVYLLLVCLGGSIVFGVLGTTRSVPSDDWLEFRKKIATETVVKKTVLFLSLTAMLVPNSYAGWEHMRLLLKKTAEMEGLESLVTGMTLLTSMIMFFIVVIRFNELFANNAKQQQNEEKMKWSAKISMLLACTLLIIVGFYPSPLYKYVSKSISLFLELRG